MITPTSSGGSSRIIAKEAFQMLNLRTLPCDRHEGARAHGDPSPKVKTAYYDSFVPVSR
jgi:hypothetical protein